MELTRWFLSLQSNPSFFFPKHYLFGYDTYYINY
jgi:hypothetical protein